jgi:predicted double-glycine peptidase
MRLAVLLLAVVVALAAAPLKNGCGAESVATVLAHWSGKPVSAGPIYRELYEPERNGIQLAAMRRYLERQGLRAYTLRAERQDVAGQVEKGRPVIVGLRTKAKDELHFAVVTGVERGRLLLRDPARKGVTRLSNREFDRRWALAGRWMLVAAPVVR